MIQSNIPTPSETARTLAASSEIIDLHIDTFIWSRILGYDLRKRHGRGPFGGRFFGQADLPRLKEANVTGGIWSITTNPFRTRSGRAKQFRKNIESLKDVFGSVPEAVEIVRSHSDFLAARAKGRHAAFIGIQGGNALEAGFDLLPAYGKDLIKVTLVHLLNSAFGTTSSPARFGGEQGLTRLGKDFVRELNRHRIFVDLAHISRKGFFDTLEVHDLSQPFIVSHTGVNGAYTHWRNLDDEQIRKVADSGGTIGIMYQSSFLTDCATWKRARPEAIIHHIEHVIRTVGEDYVSLGSDWDGMIVPPHGMESCLEIPVLIQLMLDRKWSEERIRKVLGGNFLRALKLLRP